MPTATKEPGPPAGHIAGSALNLVIGGQSFFPLGIGITVGFYAALLSRGPHAPLLTVLAGVAPMVGSAAIAYARPRWAQGLGYLLGLASIGFAIRATDLALLAYGPWTILGAVVFPTWTMFAGLGTAGVTSFVVGRLSAGHSPFAVMQLATAAMIGLVHLGAVVLTREAQAHATLALTDPLTGLANRRMLLWRLAEEVARARRSGTTLALLYLDVDGFKRVNDTFGYHAGDRTLIQIAQALQAPIRPYDLLARVGGDEFIVLAPDLPDEGAARLAARLQAAVTRAHLVIPVGLSTGWIVAPQEAETPEALMDLADAALFAHRGRTRAAVHVLTRELVAALQALPVGAQRLVHLLDAEEIELEEHMARVAQRSLLLARASGAGQDRHRTLAQAAILHDIGKLSLPRKLLDTPGPLSPDAWTLMTQHVPRGTDLLRGLGVDEAVIAVVAAHHERWDGTGYPEGLAGEAIPPEARMLTLADSYDAMTTSRPYRPARSLDDAIAELRREAGRHFDPHLVDLFVQLLAAPDAEQATVGPVAPSARVTWLPRSHDGPPHRVPDPPPHGPAPP